MSSGSSVVELRQAATDSNVRVITLLRKAKVVATKLNLAEALTWINDEIDGYPREGTELPAYRKLTGELMAFNRYRGWEPVRYKDPEFADTLCQAPIGQALGAIEESLLKCNNTSLFTFSMSPAHKASIMQLIKFSDDVRLQLYETNLFAIVDAVRHLILNWALELESKGILGDGVNFNQAEQQKAVAVTHHYFIQNAGVVGNVTGKATITNYQSAFTSADVAAWQNAVAQIKAAMPSAPVDLVSGLTSVVSEIERELSSSGPQTSKLKALAESAIRTCEGTAGNLIAAGIGAILSNLIRLT